MDYIIKDGELYHHGVLGQKWGVRRFQNKDGSLTDAGKKRISRKQKKALEKARKAKHDKAEAAKKAKQEQEDFEKNKKRVLESGSAAEVAKYKGKLTNKELQDVVNRLNMEQRVSELAVNKEPSRIEKITDRIDKANKFADKGITGWNNIAKILNATTNADLPIIDGNKKKDKAVEKARKKLIESGTPEQIKKHFGKLSVKDLEDINKRFNYEDNISRRVDTKKADDAAKEAVNKEKAQKNWEHIEKWNKDKAQYDKQQAEANARFKAEREARAAKKNTSSETYIAGLLESGNKGSTTVAGLLSAPNQKYIDSGSNYIAGLLAPPKDRDD